MEIFALYYVVIPEVDEQPGGASNPTNIIAAVLAVLGILAAVVIIVAVAVCIVRKTNVVHIYKRRRQPRDGICEL